MSTKIYTGFRLSPCTWEEAHRRFMDFRQELAAIIYDERQQQCAEACARLVDRRQLGMELASDRSVFSAVASEVAEEQHREPLRFDISVFPHDGRIFGMTFGREAHEALWFSLHFVQRWGYWNNTDRPDDVSERRWAERRRTWDRILGDRTPAMAGFLVQCVDRCLPSSPLGGVLRRIPSLDRRAKDMAIDLLYEQRCDRAAGPASAFMAFRKWLATPEGQGQLAAEQKRIRGLLAPVITKEMLIGEASQ